MGTGKKIVEAFDDARLLLEDTLKMPDRLLPSGKKENEAEAG